LRAWAKNHPRRGFRNAYHDARGEGWYVNHKKIQRLWREEGLRVPQKRRRKRLGTSTTPNLPVADAPNTVWAAGFQFDATADGRRIKIASIVDEHTCECLGGLVERTITGDDLINELDRVAAVRGYPAVLRCDNGPELACVVITDWPRTSRPALHPARRAVAQRLRRVVQVPHPRRVPEHQHLLEPGPGPRRDHRLEGGLQPPPTAQFARLPDTHGLRRRPCERQRAVGSLGHTSGRPRSQAVSSHARLRT
jgi:transposase InsO family protein